MLVPYADHIWKSSLDFLDFQSYTRSQLSQDVQPTKKRKQNILINYIKSHRIKHHGKYPFKAHQSPMAKSYVKMHRCRYTWMAQNVYATCTLFKIVGQKKKYSWQNIVGLLCALIKSSKQLWERVTSNLKDGPDTIVLNFCKSCHSIGYNHGIVVRNQILDRFQKPPILNKLSIYVIKFGYTNGCCLANIRIIIL